MGLETPTPLHVELYDCKDGPASLFEKPALTGRTASYQDTSICQPKAMNRTRLVVLPRIEALDRIE